MAQPTPYVRQANFTDHSTNFPTTPHSGVDLDAEYNAVKQTLDETLANLALLQRDDTKLANLSVHPDSLAEATRALMVTDWTPRGAWGVDAVYAVKDVVEHNGASYVATVGHTAVDFDADLAAGKWLVLSGAASGVVFTPYGGLSATDVQSAIEELEDEKATVVALQAEAQARSDADAALDAQIAALDAAKEDAFTDASAKTVTATGGDTPRALADRFGDMLSVLDFGAVGDGVTDNYDAFNAAMAAAAGRRLFVPKGTYRVDLSSGVDFRPPANVILEGDGPESIIEAFSSGDTSPRTLFNCINDNLVFRDLQLRVAGLPTGGTCFVFNHGNHGLLIERVVIDGGCREVSGALNWRTEVIRLPNAGDYSDITIRGCEWHHFKLGFLKTNTATSTQRRIRLQDNYFHDFFSKVFTFNTPAGIVDDVLVQGNTFENSLASTVGIPGEHFGGGASVTNMRITENTFLGSNGSEVLHFEERARNIVIADNTLYADGSLCSIQENNVGDGSYVVPYYITITGNTCRRLGASPGHEGIVLVSNAIPTEPGRRIVIANNTLKNYAVGIRLNRPNNEIICQSNVVEGCTEGMLVTTGSPSIRDNLFSNCDVGITLADGGMVGPQFFRNCPVFITSINGLATMEGWRISPDLFDLQTGVQEIVLALEGTRIDGKLTFHFFANSGLYRYGSRDILNDSSFSDTSKTAGGIGGVSVTGVAISGGNLVLVVNNTTGAVVPNCRFAATLDGHHTFS